MMVAAAAMANIRRIQRHLRAHVAEQAQQAGANDASVTPSSLVSLFAHALGQLLARFFTPRRPLCRQY
jgi:alpha-beta hydrolase superfamily lysophospholipase